MTREDAILHMTLRREELKHSVGDLDEDIEAFDMAIQALEQQDKTEKLLSVGVLKDCESCKAQKPCTDAISRKQTLDAFGLSEKTRKYGGDHSGYDSMMLYEIQDVIEALPSISTEKTGRWEWNQYDYNPNLGNWHCSECGSIVIECVTKKDPSGVPLYKYCPNCGANMEVEE